jgi:hypothetical protein
MVLRRWFCVDGSADFDSASSFEALESIGDLVRSAHGDIALMASS